MGAEMLEGTEAVGAVPRAGRARTVWRAFEYHLTVYRRSWRGTVVSGLLLPVLFLAAMGIGLGSFVDAGARSGAVGGSYLQFVAPGLLAAVATQTASFESTYPVFGAWKWNRVYYAMLATPLRVGDVLGGHLCYVAARIAMNAACYLLVMGLFGAVGSWWGVLGVPVAVLTGAAVAAPTFALAAHIERDIAFAMYQRFAVLPMFLFSGAFFPIDQLPDLLEPLAYALPLWHGVELCRGFATGGAAGAAGLLPILAHVGYLLVWVVVGLWLAGRAFRRRLVV